MKVFVIFSIIVAVALAKPSGLAGYEFIDYNRYPASFNFHAQQPLLLTSSKGWEGFAPVSLGFETKLKTELKEESKKPQTLDVKMEEFEDFSEKKSEKDGEPKKQTLEVSIKEKKDMSEKKEMKEVKEMKEMKEKKEKKEELIYKKILVAPSYTSFPAYTSLPFAHTSKVVYSPLPVSTHSYVAPKVAYAPISSSYVPHAPWASAPVAHSTVPAHGPWAATPVAKYEVPTYSKFEYSIHEYKPPTYSYVTVKPKPVKVNEGWW